MSKKKNNLARRELRFTRALLGSNNVAIVRVGSEQMVMNWRNLKQISVGHLLQRGINELPHHWTIYLAVFCRSQTGERYIKPVEIAPAGQYKAEHLTAVLQDQITQLRGTCNPAHVLMTGWIATPYPRSLTEEEADRVFDQLNPWRGECERT